MTEKLWRLLELRRWKDKVVKACKDIQERNHAMKDVIQFHSNGEQVKYKLNSMDVYGATKQCCQRSNAKN